MIDTKTCTGCHKVVPCGNCPCHKGEDGCGKTCWYHTENPERQFPLRYKDGLNTYLYVCSKCEVPCLDCPCACHMFCGFECELHVLAPQARILGSIVYLNGTDELCSKCKLLGPEGSYPRAQRQLDCVCCEKCNVWCCKHQDVILEKCGPSPSFKSGN